jgi:hypothetical protein
MRVSFVAVFLCILPASSLRLTETVFLEEKSKDIYSFIDSSCKVTVDTKQKKLFLKSETGNFVVSNGQVEDENGKVIGATTPKPMVCESDTGPTEKSHAFFVVASSAPYLNEWLDPYFNKHCWAKANGIKYYLFFGEATPEMTNMYQKKSPDAAKCSGSGLNHDGGVSHYYFPIGMKIVLEMKSVSWLQSMDISDSWFNGAHFNNGAQVMKSILNNDLPDISFAAQFGNSSAFVNGALWAIKNTEWSKQFLEDVYKNRCGNMNQQAYWNTLLQHYKKEKPDFLYDENAMAEYRSAKSYMLSVVKPMLSPAQQEVYTKYRKDAVLREPLHFGKHMVILPNAAPKGAAPGSFVGFRGDRDGGEPFLCHSPPHHWMSRKPSFKEVENTGFDFDFDGQMAPNKKNKMAEGEHRGCGSHPCAGGATCQCEA